LRERAAAAQIARATVSEVLAEIARANGEAAAPPRTRLFAAARGHLVTWLERAGRLQSEGPLGDEESRLAGFDLFEPDWARSTAEAHADRDAAHLVWLAASALPPWQYVALDLALRQGLRADDLAAALGAPRQSVESALAEAERALDARARSYGVGAPAVEGPIRGRQVAEGRPPRDLFAALTPVPMPVELRNAVWREVVQPWPAVGSAPADGGRPPAEPRPLRGAGPADGRPGRAAAAGERPGRGPAPADPTVGSDADAATRDEPGPPSPYVGSRAGNELLARTRRERLQTPPGSEGSPASHPAGDEGVRPVEPPPTPATVTRPVRLRARGDGSGLGGVALLVLLLFAAGIGVGVFSGGGIGLAAFVEQALSAPTQLIASSPPETPTSLASDPTPAAPLGVALAAEPTSTPTETGTPTSTASVTPTPTPSATASPTATSTPSPTATSPQPPTATHSPLPTATRPPPPPATAPRPPPTATPVPPPPPPPPTQPEATTAPPTQPPAQPPPPTQAPSNPAPPSTPTRLPPGSLVPVKPRP
jgi:DNA-directed RNA polymerase specialized sigma24 family protein